MIITLRTMNGWAIRINTDHILAYFHNGECTMVCSETTEWRVKESVEEVDAKLIAMGIIGNFKSDIPS